MGGPGAAWPSLRGGASAVPRLQAEGCDQLKNSNENSNCPLRFIGGSAAAAARTPDSVLSSGSPGRTAGGTHWKDGRTRRSAPAPPTPPARPGGAQALRSEGPQGPEGPRPTTAFPRGPPHLRASLTGCFPPSTRLCALQVREAWPMGAAHSRPCDWLRGGHVASGARHLLARDSVAHERGCYWLIKQPLGRSSGDTTLFLKREEPKV